MDTLRLVLLASILLGSASASAATALAPVGECANCSAAQMQTKAKNTMPLGLGFVYDLPHHIIRKYELYRDSSCAPQPSVHLPDVPLAPNCGYGAHDFLQITRLGTQIIDVSWSCIQN